MIQVEHHMEVMEVTSFKRRAISELVGLADLVLLNGDVIKDRFGINDGKAPTRLVPDYTRILELQGGLTYMWWMETVDDVDERYWFVEQTPISVMPAGMGGVGNMRVPKEAM